jgi:ribose/xylose/arabinose/galactoside ABC-type transport system permease subunit
MDVKQKRWMPRNIASLTPVFGVLFIVVAALLFAPEFFVPSNLSNLSRQVAILAVVAAGQTLVLLVRGVDLSVGATITLSMIIVARVSEGQNDRLMMAVGIALVAGVIVGAVNAFLVVVRRVPPFVATIATTVLILGVQTAWTQGVPGGSVPPALAIVGTDRWFGLPSPTVIAAVILGIVALALTKTVWGKWVYATGGNPEAARLSGVPTAWVTSSTYIACAVLAVFAGFLLGGYIGYVDAYLGVGYDLDSIAAAVIGGTSFAGGVGGIGRSVIGAIIISSVLNIISISGAAEWLQLVVKGVIIAVAVALQTTQWGRRGG